MFFFLFRDLSFSSILYKASNISKHHQQHTYANWRTFSWIQIKNQKYAQFYFLNVNCIFKWKYILPNLKPQVIIINVINFVKFCFNKREAYLGNNVVIISNGNNSSNLRRKKAYFKSSVSILSKLTKPKKCTLSNGEDNSSSS